MNKQPTTEGGIQRQIMLALSAAGHRVLRANVGLFFSKDGRPVRIGVPGEADLHGHRAPDGRAFYLECKRPGEKPTAEQLRFLAAMAATGALTAVVRSVDEALAVLAQTDVRTETTL